MQKTLRINLLARNQAVKRARKQKARQTFNEWKEYETRDATQEQKMRDYRKEERAHRHEDWKLGPLAPNRGVGKEKGKFGTISYDLQYNYTLPKDGQSTPRLPGYNRMSSEEVDNKYPRFKGKTILGNVAAGDRVVIVQGPTRVRGQIGIVSSVDDEREELRISNVNINDVERPHFMIAEPTKDNPNPDLFISSEGMIPMRNVRLVVRDERTKTEYIVSHVHADEPYIQRKFGSNLPSHTRYITGSEHWSRDGLPVEIPWPTDEKTEDLRSTPNDTGRQDVEERTWDPSLYHSPLGYNIGYNADILDPQNAYLAGYAKNPSSTPNPAYKLGLGGFSNPTKVHEREVRIASGIMDELRKKSARSNRNHDNPEWVTQKLMEDARSIWWKDRQIKLPQEIQAQSSSKKLREQQEARIMAIVKQSEAKAQSLKEAAIHNALLSIEQNAEKSIAKAKGYEFAATTKNKDIESVAKSVKIARIQLIALEQTAKVLLDSRLTTNVPPSETKPEAQSFLLKDTEDIINQALEATQGSPYHLPEPKLRRKLKHMLPEVYETTSTSEFRA